MKKEVETMIWVWVLLIAAVLAAALLFLIAPSAGDTALRAPFANRNYAHRGLFTKDQQTPENSLPAFAAATAAGYGIELDVQFTADRKLIVFHDDTLDRMTGTKGWVKDYPYAQVAEMPLAGTAHHAPLFTEVLATVGGKVPLIIEIKSRQEYTAEYLDALCRDTLQQLEGYDGAYCIESFDPRIVQRIRKMAPGVLRGQLLDSYRSYRREGAGCVKAFCISHCLCNFLGRPNFMAWCPDPQNWALRACDALGAMMVYWTALPTDDNTLLDARYDAVIFQWYCPPTHYTK